MMGRKRNRQSEQFVRSALHNVWDFTDYEDMLTEIALSRFEWKNLPETCDERYLERALYYNGQAIYCHDDVVGDLTLKCALGGKFDVYGVPVDRRGYGDNEYQIYCKPSNSVIIFNNYKRKPTYPVIRNYAMRLYEIDRTIDVNVNAQKTPIIILCDENERLSFENLYTMYEGNRPVIYGKKGLDPDSVQVLTTGAPYVSDKLYTLKTNLFNEVMTFLGIANVSIEKRERLVSDEVSRALGGTIANRESFLAMRKQAANKINKMFGTNIEVGFRGDEEDGDAFNDNQTEQEAVDNE